MLVQRLIFVIIVLVLGNQCLNAAEFIRRGLDTIDLVELRGPIEEGDFERFRDIVQPSRQRAGPVFGVSVNSRGGDIAEADRISQFVALKGWDVVVGARNVCASACFLILASGRKKLVHEDAYIGIHGASNRHGQQDQAALAATTFMARAFKRLGVPDNLVGRMVTTPPDRMTWLRANDLLPMKVEIILRDEARLSSIKR
jgi:hypothetical protein